MKKLAIVALALALLSCKPSGSPDGYFFEAQSKRLPDAAIQVQTYPSYAALKRAYSAYHNGRVLGSNEDLQAFSVIKVGQSCTIHMIDPKVTYQPEFFGHELTHCLYGEFHPSQNGNA